MRAEAIVSPADFFPRRMIYLRDLLRELVVREMKAQYKSSALGVAWTVGLLGTTTVLSFTIGTFLGALLAWPRAPRSLRLLMPPLWALHAIPFFLCGLILMYLLAFQLQWLPMFGGYTAGAFPGLTLAFVSDVLQHAMLPALSIILVAANRGVMQTRTRSWAPQSCCKPCRSR